MPVALGRGGIRATKTEGDGATPLGTFALRRVHYRPDRVARPRTALQVVALRPNHGWCDHRRDRNYNRQVYIPYPASCERLWRNDHLYDLFVEIGYNDGPRVKGRGSAIFLHLARRDFSPTAGCVAMRKADLIKLLSRLGQRPVIAIAPKPRPVQRRRRGLR